jgi:hypothetical protein
MLGTLDVRGVQENSQDIACLRGYLQQLAGEPFLCARFSYGDELILHFGEPRKSRSKKLSHLVQGSYVVAARASSWYFKTAGGATVTMATNGSQANVPTAFVPLTTEQVEGSQFTQPGARVVAADVAVVGPADAAGFTCSLLLSDGSSVLIVPEIESAPDVGEAAQDVADWEVFITPHNRYLRVGPGPIWSYLASSP